MFTLKQMTITGLGLAFLVPALALADVAGHVSPVAPAVTVPGSTSQATASGDAKPLVRSTDSTVKPAALAPAAMVPVGLPTRAATHRHFRHRHHTAKVSSHYHHHRARVGEGC